MVDAHLAVVRASLRAQLTYRVSFAMLVVASAGATSMDFAVVATIFTHLPRLEGWTLSQIALMYGIAGIGFGVTDLAVGSLDSLPAYVKQGTFDAFLIRPLGTLYQVVTSEVALRRVGKIAQGAGILVFALLHLHIAWTLPRAGMLLMSLVTGPLIFGSVWVIVMSHVFWTVDTGEVANAFTYGGSFLASYPINIFGTWLRDLLAFVVPMAFVAYYPTIFILGRPDPLGLPGFVPLLTPVLAVLLPWLAGGVWKQGVRHYRGTGS
ncbi:MAG TPA: ABC-2 family transporter protein [Candidatus Dormibacteraeota bacterium]|nr:ABC-2 family transporter protein [Candidatus Dormibacteraeota bacterium]